MQDSSDDERMASVLQLLDDAPAAILPDPKVAAVIFDVSGAVLATYNKQRFGEPHSEAQAVLKALRGAVTSYDGPQRDQVSALLATFERKLMTPRAIRGMDDLEDLERLVLLLGRPFERASIFVNLEPCSHFGKNPSCAAIIAAAGFKRAVFSHFDPDPDVCGRGEELLQSRGVSVSHGHLHLRCLEQNHVFCKIARFMPKLFEGVHPVAVPTKPPWTMLGLMVPKSEVRTTDVGKTINVHTYQVAPRRHTITQLRTRGAIRISKAAQASAVVDLDAVLFSTLLNPIALADMIVHKFKTVPGTIIAAVPDMGFELGKEECIEMLKEQFPHTHVCVGVRMAAIRDKLAQISLRRRLGVERDKAGKVAIVVMAKGVPHDGGRVETRFMDLVGATTIHVSRLEDFLVMLRFLREDVEIFAYLGGDLLASKWKDKTLRNLAKLLERVPKLEIGCTDETVVNALNGAHPGRSRYLEPYWEMVE